VTAEEQLWKFRVLQKQQKIATFPYRDFAFYAQMCVCLTLGLLRGWLPPPAYFGKFPTDFFELFPTLFGSC
jgi:hypothetical protein